VLPLGHRALVGLAVELARRDRAAHRRIAGAALELQQPFDGRRSRFGGTGLRFVAAPCGTVLRYDARHGDNVPTEAARRQP
jgi:hypothetical protein